MRVNSPLNNMIQYVFAIDDKSEVKYFPAKYSKYQAYKDCKKHYPNQFVSYVGKYCDDWEIKYVLKKLKFQLNKLKSIKLKLLNNEQSIKQIDLDIAAIKHEIRQLEFRLT